MDFGFGVFQSVFPFIFLIIFIIIIGFFIGTGIRGLSGWNKNQNSPRLTVLAKLVSKRINYNRNMNRDIGQHMNTSYYITFEVQSGDRMEFNVSGTEYGLLVEGDVGKLDFQGTRFLGFERDREAEF